MGPKLPPLAISIHIACRTKSAQAGLPCRIHALFHTDKICCEPLTEWLHFADLRDGQPEYMVYLVRSIQALGVLVNSVCVELAAAYQPSKSPAARNKQLNDGIPYMLRNDRLVLYCQIGHNQAAALHCSCTALQLHCSAPHRRCDKQDGTEEPACVLLPIAFHNLCVRWCCKFLLHFCSHRYCLVTC